ncbi:MAG: hypothetical protein HQL85_19080 [Magnetococcales bacterium]|nr:hypothetical protein [Magnetococcales bacterium]
MNRFNARRAIGNLLFSGCLLACDRDFNRTTQVFQDRCEIFGRVLNITDGSNHPNATTVEGFAALLPQELQKFRKKQVTSLMGSVRRSRIIRSFYREAAQPFP